MAEVGKRDDAGFAHAGCFAQHDLGIAQMLQRIDLQHHVKRGVVKHRKAFVQVELDDVDAALHAGQHVGIGDLDAVAGTSAGLLEVGQHGTVAATQVKHARALRNQVGNGFHRRSVTHTDAPVSFKTLSK